jgi:hypothetical protein
MASKELTSALREAYRKYEVALRYAEAQHYAAMEHGVFPDLALDIALENLKYSRQNFSMVLQEVKAFIDKVAKDINYDAKVPKTCCAHEQDVADVPEEHIADVLQQDSGGLGVNDPETGEELEHNMATTEEMEKSSIAGPGETVEQNMAAPEEMVECNAAAPEEMVEPAQLHPKKTGEHNTAAPEKMVEPSSVASKETMEHKDALQSD